MTQIGALARRLPEALAAQDRLDLLAVADGWKPVAILGADGEAWPHTLSETLASHGLQCEIGAPWRIAGQWDDLPGWYQDGIEEAMNSQSLLFVAAGPVDPAPGSVLSMAQEALALAYPYCCVDEHHARQHALHALCARQIGRRVKDDAARARLAFAGLPPVPVGEGERRALVAATRVTFAPLTPVAMCALCVRDDYGPAARLSRRYAELEARALA